MQFYGLTEFCLLVGIPPRTLSDMLYTGKLDRRDFPVVGNRRLIPKSMVPAVRKALQEAGKLSEVSQ